MMSVLLLEQLITKTSPSYYGINKLLFSCIGLAAGSIPLEMAADRIAENPDRCGDYGSPQFELVPLEECDTITCEYPATMCRYNFERDAFSCWHLSEDCQEFLGHEPAPVKKPSILEQLFAELNVDRDNLLVKSDRRQSRRNRVLRLNKVSLEKLEVDSASEEATAEPEPEPEAEVVESKSESESEEVQDEPAETDYYYKSAEDTYDDIYVQSEEETEETDDESTEDDGLTRAQRWNLEKLAELEQSEETEESQPLSAESVQLSLEESIEAEAEAEEENEDEELFEDLWDSEYETAWDIQPTTTTSTTSTTTELTAPSSRYRSRILERHRRIYEQILSNLAMKELQQGEETEEKEESEELSKEFQKSFETDFVISEPLERVKSSVPQQSTRLLLLKQVEELGGLKNLNDKSLEVEPVSDEQEDDDAAVEVLVSKSAEKIDAGSAQDYHIFCCYWAARDDTCNANKMFMRPMCQKSCGTPACTVDDVDACEVTVNVDDCVWLQEGGEPLNNPDIPAVPFRRRSLGADRSNEVVDDIVGRLARHEQLLENSQKRRGQFSPSDPARQRRLLKLHLLRTQEGITNENVERVIEVLLSHSQGSQERERLNSDEDEQQQPKLLFPSRRVRTRN